MGEKADAREMNNAIDAVSAAMASGGAVLFIAPCIHIPSKFGKQGTKSKALRKGTFAGCWLLFAVARCTHTVQFTCTPVPTHCTVFCCTRVHCVLTVHSAVYRLLRDCTVNKNWYLAQCSLPAHCAVELHSSRITTLHCHALSLVPCSVLASGVHVNFFTFARTRVFCKNDDHDTAATIFCDADTVVDSGRAH